MGVIWLDITSFLCLYFLAIITPGSNFVMVLNTAMTNSRQASIMTALGVATGSGLFAFAGLFGLILLINNLPYFHLIMGLAGGSYLIFTGVNILWQFSRTCHEQQDAHTSKAALLPSPYRAGLITNLTNPKAWAFYFSLFTLTVTSGYPLWAKYVLTIAMFLISFGWYTSVALLSTNRRFQPLLARIFPVIQGILGLLLIWLGGRLIFF
jgi:threonine/homoserine/homoserine lactone efflux protein